ncbi:Receptor-transporting protein 3-like 1, partial [Homarus americanus]
LQEVEEEPVVRREEPVARQEEAVGRAKSTFQELSTSQAKSTSQTKKAVSDFLTVLQGLSVPDETAEGSDNVAALVFPLTIPVPPSTQAIQKNLNQLATDYFLPTNEYLPPTNEYLPPINEYLPPTNEYLPPINEYLPPSNEYLPPLF